MNVELKHSDKLPGEVEEFEKWLAKTCPSGDVDEVQRAWQASAEYSALLEAREETANRQLRTYNLTNCVMNWHSPLGKVVMEDVAMPCGYPARITFELNKNSLKFDALREMFKEHELQDDTFPVKMTTFHAYAHDVRPRRERKRRQEQFAKARGLTLKEVKAGMWYKTERARVLSVGGSWHPDKDSWIQPTGESVDYIIHDEPLPEPWEC